MCWTGTKVDVVKWKEKDMRFSSKTVESMCVTIPLILDLDISQSTVQSIMLLKGSTKYLLRAVEYINMPYFS